MTDKPIDFEAVKDRREAAEINADEAHWQAVSDRLVEVMATAGLHDTSLISATLRSLLDVLMADRTEVDRDGTAHRAEGLSLDDAKDRIAASLRVFFER